MNCTSRRRAMSVRRLLASFALGSLLAGAAAAAPIYRTDAVPGDTDWFTTSNWYNEALGIPSLPTMADDVTIGDANYLNPATVDVVVGGDGGAMAGSLALAYGAGTAATLNLLPTGSLSLAAYLAVGYGGTGTLHQSGGALQAAVTGVGIANLGSPGVGSFHQTGGTHAVLAPLGEGGASGLLVGFGTDASGAYSLSGADALLLTPSALVGFLGGSGAFTHTAGTHLITSDASPLDDFLPGFSFPGLFLGFGMAEDPSDEGAWTGYPSAGSYALTGGTLTLTRAPALPQIGAPIGTVVWLGTSGTGTLLLGDANATGTLNETDPPQPAGDEVGVSLLARPFPYEGGDSATVRGWGTVGLTGMLLNNGRVIADGYGVDRDLDLRSFSLVTSTAGLDPIYAPLLQGDGTQAGWYAQNHGRLLLPTHTLVQDPLPPLAFWGTAPDEQGQAGAPVNSLFIAFQGLQEPPDLSIALLAPDHGDVPPGTTGSILGIWDIAMDGTLPEETSAMLAIRYDDFLASALGLAEEDILIYHFDGLGWVPLTTFVDTQNHLAIAGDITSFSPFAVGLNITNQPAAIPEPATLALLALGGLGLLRRRRRHGH